MIDAIAKALSWRFPTVADAAHLWEEDAALWTHPNAPQRDRPGQPLNDIAFDLRAIQQGSPTAALRCLPPSHLIPRYLEYWNKERNGSLHWEPRPAQVDPSLGSLLGRAYMHYATAAAMAEAQKNMGERITRAWARDPEVLAVAHRNHALAAGPSVVARQDQAQAVISGYVALHSATQRRRRRQSMENDAAAAMMACRKTTTDAGGRPTRCCVCAASVRHQCPGRVPASCLRLHAPGRQLRETKRVRYTQRSLPLCHVRWDPDAMLQLPPPGYLDERRAQDLRLAALHTAERVVRDQLAGLLHNTPGIRRWTAP